jgi:hypothetical protein
LLLVCRFVSDLVSLLAPFASSPSTNTGTGQKLRKLSSFESPSAALSQSSPLPPFAPSPSHQSVAVEYEAADVLLGLAVGNQDSQALPEERHERLQKTRREPRDLTVPLQAIPVALPATLEEATLSSLSSLAHHSYSMPKREPQRKSSFQQHGYHNGLTTNAYREPELPQPLPRSISGQRIGALRVPISQPQMKLQLLLQKQQEQQRLLQQRQAQQQREAAYHQAQQQQMQQQQQQLYAREIEIAERERSLSLGLPRKGVPLLLVFQFSFGF